MDSLTEKLKGLRSSLKARGKGAVHGQAGLEWVGGGGVQAFSNDDTRFLKAAEIVAGLDGHATKRARDRGIAALIFLCFAAFNGFGWYMQAQKAEMIPITIERDKVGTIGEVKVAGPYTPTIAQMGSVLSRYIKSCFTKWTDNLANGDGRNDCANIAITDGSNQPIKEWILKYEERDFARYVKVIRVTPSTANPLAWTAIWEEEGFDESGRPAVCRRSSGNFMLLIDPPINQAKVARNIDGVYVRESRFGYESERKGGCDW